jgi:hydroxymethylglutaryl-CoA lyase
VRHAGYLSSARVSLEEKTTAATTFEAFVQQQIDERVAKPTVHAIGSLCCRVLGEPACLVNEAHAIISRRLVTLVEDEGAAVIEVIEVSPRDGLQNEPVLLPTAAKVELIRRAIAAGARRIEAVSFVRPDAVPAMADAEAVMDGVPRVDGVSYIGLVLNQRGFVRARAAHVDEINVVVPVSDTFARRNQNAAAEELLAMAENVAADAARAGLPCSVTLAVAFGCPFEGEVDPARVLDFGVRAARAGAVELAIADTVGVGVPAQVRRLVGDLQSELPTTPLRVHFHNTRNTGYANASAAVDSGVTRLDASIGGIGGCPFAPNATGNIATEDLVYLLERSGLDTGLDLQALIETADFIGDALGRTAPSLLPRAGGFPASLTLPGPR